MKMYLLQRQESNLRPLPYESNMQPHTPRCGLEKTSILTDGCQKVNSIFQITNEQFKSRRQERSRTSIYNVVLTITPPTENPATFTSGRTK